MSAELHWPALQIAVDHRTGQVVRTMIWLPAGTFTTQSGTELMVMLTVAPVPTEVPR